ncbi:MAG: DUF364 domain-containing protein [Candidatus Hodarchaeaceae archaeon]|nr:DUF364 domain-containing protein [Candidatus Hodarchaeaceae archaeon]
MYEKINGEFKKIVEKHKLQEKEVSCGIIAKGFSDRRPRLSSTPKNFIEQHFKLPSREYALAKGKEVLVRCKLEDHYGDAFTDEPKTFRGGIEDVCELLFGDKGDKAVFFATLNATLSYVGLIRGTVHCKGDEPRKCGERLAAYILENFGKVRVAHIGYQPSHVEACSKHFESYVTDLDSENVGEVKFGRKILDGSANEEVIRKVDVACITGSTLASGTLPELIGWCETYGVKPVIYGVTSKGAAKILNLRHFCPYGHDHP